MSSAEVNPDIWGSPKLIIHSIHLFGGDVGLIVGALVSSGLFKYLIRKYKPTDNPTIIEMITAI